MSGSAADTFPANGAILGVDLGQARIGLAICEAAGLPAVPLATFAHVSRARDIAELVRYAREREAARIVVGLPLRLDGGRGPAAEKASAFAAALRAAFSGDVVEHDERLTTAAANKKLRALDLSGSKRRRYVDQLAAVELLNSYAASLKRP